MPNSSTDKIIKAITKDKQPVYLEPYKEPKVWGPDGIGEYWYGAESGGKSSIAVIGENAAPMIDIVNSIPEEILGKKAIDRFGRLFPLVKILTPRGRLSVQFHDTKNELWVITGIDASTAWPDPAIIVGFSTKCIDLYGRNVTEHYGKSLWAYGEDLNKLISAVEDGGYRDLLNETKDVISAAEHIGNKNLDIKKILAELKSSRERLEKFYNYLPVKIGDVVPVPSGTLHALGPGIQVIEPQIAGSTQSLEDGATYPVRYYFPGHKRPGAEKKLDLDRVGEMKAEAAVRLKPEIISGSAASAFMVERLPGNFEDKGLEVHRITLEANAELKKINTCGFHNLVALENEAQLIAGNTEFIVPKASSGGKMLIVPAVIDKYTVRSREKTRIIDTFIPV